MKKSLPEPWKSEYEARSAAIQARLADFQRIQRSEYFYELAFCILTPQSSAKNADATIGELKQDRFLELGFDPTKYLRDPKHYVRFHNVKSARLLKIRERWTEIEPILNINSDPQKLRNSVLEAIPGFGMKEASHFLRNIGVKSLAILDRHIFKHLSQLKVIPEIPRNAPTKKRYLEIEALWTELAKEVGISLDELDLLFWSMETGEIRK